MERTESIESKQQYLRENIIDAGYDAEDFVQYCSAKHNLEDLGDWPLTKLIDVVQLYVAIKVNEENNHQVNQNNADNENQGDKKDEDNDWTNFSEAPVNTNPAPQAQHEKEAKKQHEPTHNVTKTGHLVFSEDDWAIFLGSGSSLPVSNTTNQPPQTKNQETPNQSINTTNNNSKKPSQTKKPSKKSEKKVPQAQIKLGDMPKSAFQQPVQKQIPLSPPSQQTSKKQQSTIKSLIEQNSLKTPNRGPINFTNIKLQTSKIKQLPKLPQINDIVITKTEQVARNFLQSDYTIYYIHFMPGNHVIQRKFTDLRKLRGLLKEMYPHIRLPYLEPEGWLTSSEGKDTETLAKYKWMVLDFLKYIILRNEELRNCPLVRKFCGFTTNLKATGSHEEVSKSQLKKLLEAYENVPKPKNIGQLCLSNNFIILPPSNDCQKTLHNTCVLLEQIDHQYERLKKKFENLFYYYDCLAKSLAQVSSSFQSLQNLIKKYNFDNDEPKELRVYEGIREMCNKMHNSMNEQCVVFKTRVKNILRFEKDNMMTLKEQIDSRNKIHTEYSRQGFPTLSKSNQSSLGQVQIQSSISLQQPSKSNKNNLCVQQIFWSHFTRTQINAYFQELRKKINEQLTMISYEELDNENDNLNFWNSMIKKCVV